MQTSEMTRTEIKQAIEDFRNRLNTSFIRHKIVNDKVEVNGDCTISSTFIGLYDGKLFVPFSKTGKLLIKRTASAVLKSFEGFPEIVNHGFGPSYQGYAIYFEGVNSHITSLKHFPKYINGSVCLARFDEISYTNVDKYIDTLEGHLQISRLYVGPVLGFLRIKGLLGVEFKTESYTMTHQIDRTQRALNIVNKYLKSKDILECQDELIENGLEEYAKL